MRKRFAPEMIVQCVEAAVNLGDFDAGIAVEQECFANCLKHPQRESLIHMFFAEREVAKIPDVPKDTATQEIASAAVIGCSTMRRHRYVLPQCWHPRYIGGDESGSAGSRLVGD